MKINSINTLYQTQYKTSFKRTAVPYPEYRDAYVKPSNENIVSRLINSLFKPEVSEESNKIKAQIDKFVEQKNVKPQVLSVVA